MPRSISPGSGDRPRSRHLLRALLVASLALIAIAPPAAGAGRPHNVLFIVVDDLNADLRAFGHPLVRTPHIDQLVSRGMRFDRAYCQFTLCSPSRESFLSGRRPESTGVVSQANKVRDLVPDVTYLHEQFRKYGYSTRAVGKVFHGNKAVKWDADEGAKPKSTQENLAYEIRAQAKERAAHGVQWMQIDDPEEQLGDGIVARTAVEYLRVAERERKPFFIAAGFRKPHLPWTAPRPYFRQYPKTAIPPLPEAPMKDVPAIALMTDITPRSPRWIEEFENVHGFPFSSREAVGAYYACVSFIDAQVGLITAALDELGLRDNTVVVFLSDHGFHLGDHGGLWAKLSLFERAARVPLAISVPGQTPGNTSRIVELIDLYPTLVELCGLEPPRGLEGRSLMPLLINPSAEWNGISYTNAIHDGILGRSVRTNGWRYTEWDDGGRIVARELYSHAKDTNELRNLAGEPRLAQDLVMMQELLARIPRFPGPIPSTAQSRDYD
jgi:iduronate 2-sulfatase